MSKRKWTKWDQGYQGLLIAVVVAMAATAAGAEDLGYEFTFQGELLDDGSPVTGISCDFQFVLWDAATGGAQVGTAEDRTLPITDGKFTTDLDFSSGMSGVFTGEARWIEIHVCCESPCAPSYTTLDPRQKVTPAPHALALPGLYTLQNTTSPNVVGGFPGNVIDPGVVGGTISGGGTLFSVNSVTFNGGTVGGGFANAARELYTTVSGGLNNTASGDRSTVGGGSSNMATGVVSTVGGGFENKASGGEAFVGGGRKNTASGIRSTVPGGSNNQAGGDDSLAAGRHAIVRDAATVGDADGDEGTFIWADSTHGPGSEFVSNGPNQFLISAAGGVGIGTNAPDASLHVVEDGTMDGLQVEGSADGANPNLRLQEDGGASMNLRINESGANRFEIQMSDTSRMTVTQNGLVGIPNTSADYQLTVTASTADSAIQGLASQASSFGVYGLNVNSSGTGTIGVALSTTGTNFGVRGISNSTSGFDFYAAGAGTNYGAASSRRWKHHVRNIDEPLEKIERLRGVYYDWDAEHGGHHDVGMIAEEVGEVLPEIVTYEENGIDAIGMDYSKLTPLLVEAVKVLQTRVEQLEAEQRTTRSTGAMMRAGLPILLVGLIGLAALRRYGKDGA